MADIVFRSDVKVVENAEACAGSDRTLYRECRVLPPGADPGAPGGTLAACMRLKPNTVFEGAFFSVYVEAPGVVWWQLTRQRFMSLSTEDFSFNLESGRYKVLDPEFYVPPEGRPCLEPGGFKPMRPRLMADAEVHGLLADNIRLLATAAWEGYSAMIERGVAREVARLCLPNWAMYCDGYVSARPLSWLQFFSKRNRTPDTATPTFPQWEIEEFARQCEALFAARWPLAHEAFVANGRAAP